MHVCMYVCMYVCMITRIISGRRNEVQRMNRGRMEEFPMNDNKREMEQTMNTLVANVEHLGEILPKTVRGSALRVLVASVCVCVCVIGYIFSASSLPPNGSTVFFVLYIVLKIQSGESVAYLDGTACGRDEGLHCRGVATTRKLFLLTLAAWRFRVCGMV